MLRLFHGGCTKGLLSLSHKLGRGSEKKILFKDVADRLGKAGSKERRIMFFYLTFKGFPYSFMIPLF